MCGQDLGGVSYSMDDRGMEFPSAFLNYQPEGTYIWRYRLISHKEAVFTNSHNYHSAEVIDKSMRVIIIILAIVIVTSKHFSSHDGRSVT